MGLSFKDLCGRNIPSEVDKLISKLINGECVTSKEEMQLYVNNSEEIERRLRKGARGV